MKAVNIMKFFNKWNLFVLFLYPIILIGQVNTVSEPVALIRVVLPTNTEVVVSAPLDLLPSSDINDIFASQLTGATNANEADVIRVWNAMSFQYLDAYKYKDSSTNDEAVWIEDFQTYNTSSLSFYPGQGFYIGNHQMQAQTIFLCGYVVLDSVFNTPVYPGLNLLSYPYASSLNINDTSLFNLGEYNYETAGVTNKECVSQPSTDMQAWLEDNTVSYNYLKWLNAEDVLSSIVFTVGSGFWYNQQGTNTLYWSETRPYDDYFPTNKMPPLVSAMTITESGDGVVLSVETTGDLGEEIEVYYKDAIASGQFNALNWSVAVTGILSSGEELITWTDNGSIDRIKVDTVFSRYYLVGRGDIDSDNDNLPDSRETFVYGTSALNPDTDNDLLNDDHELRIGSNPLLQDTDNDGLDDGTEVDYGKDPTSSDTYCLLPFIENFESDTVNLGLLNGFNNWEVSPTTGALVQTNIIYHGNASLEISGQESNVVVRQLFKSPSSSIVWVDMALQAIPADLSDYIADGSVNFAFSEVGQLCVYDGGFQGGCWLTYTNHAPVAEDEWIRVTTCVDYNAQEWLICLNGVLIADELGFAENIEQFSSVNIKAERSYNDNILVATTVPTDFDLDNDGLKDYWELNNFGSFDETAQGDYDNDGLTNLQEYNLGTDPCSPDSDGDGITDTQESFYGLNPVVYNFYHTVPFVESFETNTVVMGTLSNQNNWVVNQELGALVQSNSVYEGLQTLEVNSVNNSSVEVQQFFASPISSTVWFDFEIEVSTSIPPAETPETAATFGFDQYGAIWFYDGKKSLDEAITTVTNIPACTLGEKVRITTGLDYEEQTWLLCIDGVRAAYDIGFSTDVEMFTSFTASGQKFLMDDLKISTCQPSDLDLGYDGLDYYWMNQYGITNPAGDDDLDGRSNLQEFQDGTCPILQDGSFFDGENDLVGDGSTDPFTGAEITEVASTNGSSLKNLTGVWKIDDTSIYTDSRRGSVEYGFMVQTSDLYLVTFDISDNIPGNGQTNNHSLKFVVDDIIVDSSIVSLAPGENTEVSFCTPFLDVGEHSVEVIWNNYKSYISLIVNSIDFSIVSGTDSNNNGIKDWVENRILQRNSISNIQQNSKVSPAFCEGDAKYTDIINISGTTNVYAGPNETWYANVDLPSDGSVVTNEFSFENGALILERPMYWEKTDLIREEDLIVRNGDSLLLTASHNDAVCGDVEIKVDDAIIGLCNMGDAVEYKFVSNGTYVVSGYFTGTNTQGQAIETNSSITVSVLGAENEMIAALWQVERAWTNSAQYSDELVIQWDDDLTVVETNDTLNIKTSTDASLFGVVRIGEDGDIIAQLKVSGFKIWTMTVTDVFYKEILADGSYTAETDLIMSPLVPEVYIVQEIRGDTLYLDGSLSKILYTDDFGSNGVYKNLLYQPTTGYQSVCHYTEVFQDGVLLGRIY